MEKVNWSHLFGRIWRHLGGRISPEELRFRSYFRQASCSMEVNGITVYLEEKALEVLVAFTRYEKRRRGYESAIHANKYSNLKPSLDVEGCKYEIRDLFCEADTRYRELCDRCRIAHQLKGNAIPEDALNAELFESLRLRMDLMRAAQTLNDDRPDFT